MTAEARKQTTTVSGLRLPFREPAAACGRFPMQSWITPYPSSRGGLRG